MECSTGGVRERTLARPGDVRKEFEEEQQKVGTSCSRSSWFSNTSSERNVFIAAICSVGIRFLVISTLNCPRLRRRGKGSRLPKKRRVLR